MKALNKALLAHFYAVKHWDIPDGFLCPPVPGRADYIHHLADLLAGDSGEVPKDATILILAPALTSSILIALTSMAGALPAVKSTAGVRQRAGDYQRQPGLDPADPPAPAKSQSIFHGVIHKNETYDATLCNPPFHDSAEAPGGGERKRRNLGLGAESDLTLAVNSRSSGKKGAK